MSSVKCSDGMLTLASCATDDIRSNLSTMATMNRSVQELKESDERARASHAALLRFYTAVGFKLQLETEDGRAPRQLLIRNL